MKNQLRIVPLVSLINLTLLLLLGCGGNEQKPMTSEVPVILTIHDIPPMGITILAFDIQITGVTMQGTGSNNADVSLLSSPVTVQLQNLATLSELLAKTSVPAGTYDSLKVTFAGASVTVLNRSGQTLTVGNQSCTTGQICQFQPTFNQLSSIITTTPFPLTLTIANPVSIALNFNVASSVQGNLTVTPTLTAFISTAQLGGNLVSISGLTGQVTSVGNNQITLTDSNTGQPLTLAVGNHTLFNGFMGCAANNSTCVQRNQIVTVNFAVDATGQTLIPSSVSLSGNFTKAITGTIVSTNPTQNQASVVVTSESPSIPGINVGQQILVSPNTGATLGISAAGASIPTNLSFQQTSDLLAGQSIIFDGSNVTPGTIPTVATSQIQLVPTQFSGTVSAINGNNLMVNGLNGVFASGGINQVQVQTGSQTQFQNTTGTSGLTVGNNVTLGGFLFNTQGGAVLVGQQVVGPPIAP